MSLKALIAPRRQNEISAPPSKKVAGKLGNTPTICRKCYVLPQVLNSYIDGKLVLELKKSRKRIARRRAKLETGRSCRPRPPARPAREESRAADGKKAAREGRVGLTRRSS